VNFLLDTHVLLWWLFNDAHLSANAKAIIADPNNRLYVSSASGWEIATKFRLGKLPSAQVLVQDIAGWIGRAGFLELPIGLAHAQQAGLFPHGHRDPFDRMLAAQSAIEKFPLISNDSALRAFGVPIIW
jgi:PIN domain nuclease of toxin-antitoxin system